jgi:hypothetical protein
MAISGGAKFFDRNQALAIDGTEAVGSTGNTTVDLALDRNPNTFWRSVGSADITTETITITFPSATTITRILLLDHNFKGFNIQYDLASVWTHFTSVVGLDGALANLTETAFADSSAYYEVASVSTTGIRIQVTTTQVANAEKFLCQFIATTELGTLQGFPMVDESAITRTERVNKTISGKVISQKSAPVFRSTINFSTYPVNSTYSVDLDLMLTLFERDTNFLIWLCGGRRGSSYFRYTIPGFRLKDCFEVQTVGDFSPTYYSSVYTNPVDLTMSFEEAV